MGKAYTVEEQHLYETYVMWKHNGHEMEVDLARDLFRNPRILQCTCDRTVMVVEAMAKAGFLDEPADKRDPDGLLIKFAHRLAQSPDVHPVESASPAHVLYLLIFCHVASTALTATRFLPHHGQY